MRPSFQHLGFDSVDASFLSYWVRSDKFGFHWHYHPECEISYVKSGYGTRMVGDSVEEFKEGDLLFLGSDLPHTLVSDELMVSEMEVVVVQFPKELLDVRSLEIVELSSIGQLINDAIRGLSFNDITSRTIGPKLEILPDLNGFHRYHMLLEILHELSRSESRELASVAYNPYKSIETEERIGTVCKHIHGNFTSEISLQYLSDIANMNKASFCRFFKKMTGKTAVQYINDLRISNACQLIINDRTVSQAAFESGFNSLTHFHRCFIARKQLSPLEYKKHFNHGG